MHGAWLFDLLLLVFTGGVTVLAFRELTMEKVTIEQTVEQEPND